MKLWNKRWKGNEGTGRDFRNTGKKRFSRVGEEMGLSGGKRKIPTGREVRVRR